ncbi:hypothetical protein [Flammeovirga kamogawensis]|uniref:Outer membrane beta-barrel protein n=1 Tax=Flammeovirga kamogawensis TaxID=373891 RepID=A0ABX8H269_9BACT|nr:hypothetical protein [Flammeovirga kamogawensis]MBB6460191.1 hypothetical protein [Flammeovirga kamogawensis]QWG10003.1 hypothetical protein KM029_20185 [Flammeovirga kamogawensis]TRX65511.1 hypothetical protein EO216_23615 [Flammeovirga kamogawensis]
MPNFNKNGAYYSAPIRIKFQGKHLQPFFKLIIDDVSFDTDSDAVKVTYPNNYTTEKIQYSLMLTYVIGLEFKPWVDKGINFHAVGIYADEDSNYFNHINENPSARQQYQYQSQVQLLIGCSFGFDVLKRT